MDIPRIAYGDEAVDDFIAQTLARHSVAPANPEQAAVVSSALKLAMMSSRVMLCSRASRDANFAAANSCHGMTRLHREILRPHIVIRIQLSHGAFEANPPFFDDVGAVRH